MPWASTGWEYCKSDMRWHFLLKYIQPQDITHLPAWIAIHTNELISGGKLLLTKWVGEETTLPLQPEGILVFLWSFAIFSPLLNSATPHIYTRHLRTRPPSWELCVTQPITYTWNHRAAHWAIGSSAKEQLIICICPIAPTGKPPVY